MAGRKSGVTLLELLVVMAILAILAGLGVKGYTFARRQAKEALAKSEIEKLRNALEEFRVQFGRYPQQETPGGIPRLDDLTNAVDDVELTDPWGRPYQYVCTDRFLYSIWSEGQDVQEDSDNIDPSKPGY